MKRGRGGGRSSTGGSAKKATPTRGRGKQKEPEKDHAASSEIDLDAETAVSAPAAAVEEEEQPQQQTPHKKDDSMDVDNREDDSTTSTSNNTRRTSKRLQGVKRAMEIDEDKEDEAQQMQVEVKQEEEPARTAADITNAARTTASTTPTTTTTTTNEGDKPVQPLKLSVKLRFRNYTPHDKQLLALKLEPIQPQDLPSVEKEVKDLGAVKSLEIPEVDLLHLAPKKPNWDLKRDVDAKLAKLDRRTKRAIAEIIRDRLQKENEGNEDLSNAIAMRQQMDDADSD